MGDFERIRENAVIRRDMDCLLQRGSFRAMSLVEQDRHNLIMWLGLARVLAQREITRWQTRVDQLELASAASTSGAAQDA